MDIRVLRYIVLELLLTEEQHMLATFPHRIIMNENLRKELEAFMVAFGLKSHLSQVEYIKKQYEIKGESEKFDYTGIYENRKSPFDTYGSRISYGIVDDIAVNLLKRIFMNGDNSIHGYVCPNLKAPWQFKHFDHEICLFNPSESISDVCELSENFIYNGVDFSKIKKLSLKNIITKIYKFVKLPSDNEVAIEKIDNVYDYLNIVKNSAVLGLPSISTNVDENTEMPNANAIPNTNPNLNANGNTKMEDFNPIVMMGGANNINLKFISYTHSMNGENFNPMLLEYQLESRFIVQCKLSKNPILFNFIKNIFKELTIILYNSFKICLEEDNNDNVAINSLWYNYRPIYSIDKNNFYILKPGIIKKNKEDMIKKIIEKENTDFLFDEYSLNELMGAIYGILTHAGMFTLIYKACIMIKNSNNDEYNDLKKLSLKFEKTTESIRNLFSLNKNFTDEVFLDLMINEKLFKKVIYSGNEVYDVNKGNMKNIIMDMMVNNPTTTGLVSIVRKNLNNQEYIRTRTQKQVNNIYKSVRKAPKCPTFFDNDNNNVLIVDGDEWYTVTPTGFFENIMKRNKRYSKAGPSGSTFMWINMVFGLLSVESTSENYKLLLSCIISDFVPAYHTLSEVLMIYSRENKFIEEDQYTIDKDPLKWLFKHFDINYSEEEYNKFTIHDIADKINDSINKNFS